MFQPCYRRTNPSRIQCFCIIYLCRKPTDVCVPACKLCAFGRKKGDPAGYTMALEEAWQTAASGYSEAVTEFHIVGGLHPDLPLEYFLDLVKGLKQRFPKVHIKAFTMVEIAYLKRLAKLSIE